MTQDDEAQPKQTRRRRATYPERIELRLSTQQRDRAEALCAELNARSSGRRYTLSDVVRQSLDDGCRAIERGLRAAPAGAADSASAEVIDDALTRFTDAVGDLRGDVSRMRDNLNRIAKGTHTVGVTTAADLVETQRELEALDAVDKKLLDLIQAALFKTGWGAS